MANSLGLEAVVYFIPPMTREDRRSLTYHQAFVEKLKANPVKVLKVAHNNLNDMLSKHPNAERLLMRWKEWLGLPLHELINFCLEPSMLARDMRQVTPFAGILDARERSAVIKAFRAEEQQSSVGNLLIPFAPLRQY